MKKKYIYFLFLLLLTSTFFISCGIDLKEKAIEQGKIALENKEYSKALSFFKVAKDEGNTDEEIIDLINIIDNYINAKESFEKNQLDKVKEYISNISEGYKESSINKDIEELIKGFNKQSQVTEENIEN